MSLTVTIGGFDATAPAAITAFVQVPDRAGGGNSSNRGSSSRSSSGGSSSRSSGGGTNFIPIGGGSGGGSGGIGGIICLLIVVIIVVIAVLALKRRGGSGSAGGAEGQKWQGPPPQNDPPPPPPKMPTPEVVTETMARISQRDPAFDEQQFLEGVNTSFMIVQRAWTEQLPAESRKVMIDALWVEHKAKIEAMTAQGYKNILENLHVAQSQIVNAISDADSDTLVVRLHCYSNDFDINPADNTIMRGDRLTRLWTEDWSFTRSSNATSKAGSGNRDNCPNCGAPLALDNAGVCGYCNEMVMAGKYDWVLSRIEQIYDS